MSRSSHPYAELLQFRTIGHDVLQPPPPRHRLSFRQDAVLRLHSCHARAPFQIRACDRRSRHARLICFSTNLIAPPPYTDISSLLNPSPRPPRNTGPPTR